MNDNMKSNGESLRDRIKRHEGLRLTPYQDSKGKTTIGYGRNLTDQGVSRQEAERMLDNDLAYARGSCMSALPDFSTFPFQIQDVLVEMAFQMGLYGLLGFEKMLAAIRAKQYDVAAYEMTISQWHSETPDRCEELAVIVRTVK